MNSVELLFRADWKHLCACCLLVKLACGVEYSWGSQPLTSRLPAGNLEVAGSILFTGSSASKALQLFSNMNIMCISERTFRNIQCSYLITAVRNVWMEYQTAALQLCEGRDVKVGGDARCCSPGHSAKYGSYSLMDLESGMILAVELIQVNISCFQIIYIILTSFLQSIL